MKNVPHTHSSVSVFIHFSHRLHNQPYCHGTSDEEMRWKKKQYYIHTYSYFVLIFVYVFLLLCAHSISFHPVHRNDRRWGENILINADVWKTMWESEKPSVCGYIFERLRMIFHIINISSTVSRRSFVALIAIR